MTKDFLCLSDWTLDDLEAARAVTVRWLGSRTPEERARAGLHSERGEESVARIEQLLAAHDVVHERQIARIRSAIGAPLAG